MAINTDKNSYTIIFAVAMVVVVGSLLAFTASSLKSNIVENERMEKQQNILYAMGVNENGESDIVFIGTDKVAGEFSKYIKTQLVIENGEVEEDLFDELEEGLDSFIGNLEMNMGYMGYVDLNSLPRREHLKNNLRHIH